VATTDPWDFSTTKASNIDIGGTNIGATMMASNINDAFQNNSAHTAKLLNRSSDVASASTVNLDAVSSLWVNVTGTTTTTAITLTNGHLRFIRAVGAWPLTASSSLIVNGSTSSNFTTAAGDYLIAEGYGSSVVRISVISRGDAVAGTNLPPSDDGAALGSASFQWSDLFLASGGVINWNGSDVTITHSSNTLAFAGASSGYTFATGPLQPSANDGVALGAPTVSFSDLYLATGGVVSFNNGDVTLTHSSNQLAFAGATSGYTFANGPITPASDDGAALGTTALKWSDLHLASGSVINWNNGDLTLTHSSNTLTLAGGGLSFGNEALSNYDEVNSSSPTMSAGSGTLTTVTCALTYTRIGNRVLWEATITATNIGTGSGSLIFTLPVTPAANAGGGGVNSTTAAVLAVRTASSGQCVITSAAGAFPAANGQDLIIGGNYRV
jgi:hypothetical protein